MFSLPQGLSPINEKILNCCIWVCTEIMDAPHSAYSVAQPILKSLYVIETNFCNLQTV